MGENGRAKCQSVTASQGFNHWYILDQALVRFGTTDIFVIPIEEESLVFPFSHSLFSSAGKMEIEGVVVEKVLLKLLNFFFRWCLILTAQCLKSSVGNVP
ncbi:hypothetical protein ACFX15_012760 [Malus domestica]